MENNTLLTPGQRIRPVVNEETAKSIVERLYGMKTTKITELNAYDDKNYHVLCEEIHVNPHIRSVEEHGYVLKIVNSLDSRNTSIIEAQNDVLLFLNEKNITCPLPVKNLQGTYYSLENLDGSTGKHVVRLLVYRPGDLLHRVKLTGDLLRKVGSFTARLDNALANFTHPGYDDRRTLWMLTAVPSLRQFTYVVENIADRQLVDEVIAAFEREVLQVTSRLEQGIIHGDLNEQNIVMNSDGTEIDAVIDFGDSHKACLVFELAIALCYMILQAGDVAMGKYILEGYQMARKLSDLEKSILKVTVCARLCQSVVLGAYSYVQDPQNEYLLTTQKSGWNLLRRLWPMDREEVMRAWGLVDS